MNRDFSEVRGIGDKGQSKTLCLPNSVRNIREEAFRNSTIVDIRIPEECQSIEKWVF